MKKLNYIILFFLIFFFCNTSFASQIKYTTGDYPASLSKKLLDEFINNIIVKDYEAAQKLLDSGVVIILKSNIKIEIIKTKLIKGKVKIRPFGYNFEIWTVLEAIE